jgi:hypothetical protein
MNDSNNTALNRIMQRNKPRVPPRQDEFNALNRQDVKTQKLEDSRMHDREGGIENPSTDVKTSFSQHQKTQSGPNTFATVRSTVRIHSEVDEKLRLLCASKHITKETWIEAAYLYLSRDPSAFELVLAEAKERLDMRKQIADRRRALSMQKRVLTS